MKRATVTGALIAAAIVLFALAAGYRLLVRDAPPAVAAPPSEIESSPAPSAPASAAAIPSQGFLYGRVTTMGGDTYEGRLRFGGTQEAFWGDYFNGKKDENPWLDRLPPERRPAEGRAMKLLGITLRQKRTPLELERLFMARFGDIARIEAHGRDVQVVLKSGTVFDLDRLEASDFDDGVRVWDAKRGVVDVESQWIRGLRSIELRATPPLDGMPRRLHGTVHTPDGDFTGFLQWNREKSEGTDELAGRGADGEMVRVRFDTIGSIAHDSGETIRLTRLEGPEIALSYGGDRGIYVDDPRYGRVLVSWGAFRGLDFSPAGSGPAYGDYAPGHPLRGSVTTREGKVLAGRLVFDLDESETTETLDAPWRGVDYTIPFDLVASIAAPAGDGPASVTLRSGEELQLERAGDLGEKNAGVLVFADGEERAEYVPWADVTRIDLDSRPMVRSAACSGTVDPRSWTARCSGGSCAPGTS